MQNEVGGRNVISSFFFLRNGISCHVENGQESYIKGKIVANKC